MASRRQIHSRGELIKEKQVLSLRKCLSHGLLLAARRQGIITWTEGNQHNAWYALADVDVFIRDYLTSICRAPDKKPSLNSADSGSAAKSESHPYIATGTMRAQVIAVAQASAPAILKPQKRRSRR